MIFKFGLCNRDCTTRIVSYRHHLLRFIRINLIPRGSVERYLTGKRILVGNWFRIYHPGILIDARCQDFVKKPPRFVYFIWCRLQKIWPKVIAFSSARSVYLYWFEYYLTIPVHVCAGKGKVCRLNDIWLEKEEWVQVVWITDCVLYFRLWLDKECNHSPSRPGNFFRGTSDGKKYCKPALLRLMD